MIGNEGCTMQRDWLWQKSLTVEVEELLYLGSSIGKGLASRTVVLILTVAIFGK